MIYANRNPVHTKVAPAKTKAVVRPARRAAGLGGKQYRKRRPVEKPQAPVELTPRERYSPGTAVYALFGDEEFSGIVQEWSTRFEPPKFSVFFAEDDSTVWYEGTDDSIATESGAQAARKAKKRRRVDRTK